VHVTQARTILVAEDEEAFSTVLEMLLSIDGYDVVEVADGREALAWLREHTPDLAILDVVMPHMSGIEVCSRMKRVRRLKEVPVVILTALKDQATRVQAREAGADALVVKPLQGKDFRALVQRVLDGERQSI
jgi:DNA-binding response OmpR family regulator